MGRQDYRHAWQVLLCIQAVDVCARRATTPTADAEANTLTAPAGSARVFGRNKQLFLASPQATSRHLLHRPTALRLHPWYDPSSAPPDMFGSSQDRARQLAGRHRKDRKTSASSYLSSRSVSSSTQSTTQPQPQYPLLEQTLGYVVHSKPSESKANRTEARPVNVVSPLMRHV
jgi:hypothetical protein